MSNQSILQIREELANIRLREVGEDCNGLGYFEICTGTRKVKLLNDCFFSECDLCGDQTIIESEKDKVMVEKKCLSQLVSGQYTESDEYL